MRMKTKHLLLSLALAFTALSACSSSGELVIELDENTPTAHLGKKYDFTDILYVQDGVKYDLEVYYQDYFTMEEKSLPVVDTFYFTPTETFDITVIVTAKKSGKTAKRRRIIPVVEDPEPATRYNIEMCHFEGGNWRGNGSLAQISYKEIRGTSSISSRKINFANSRDLPDVAAHDNTELVFASFNLANTSTIGVDESSAIDSKECTLSFDINLSTEFFDSGNDYRNFFYLKIEDETWSYCDGFIPLVENLSDFTYANTDNGWMHLDINLAEESDFDSLGDGTFVMTFGFYGITNTTRSTASIIFDNIALTDLPDEQKGNREKPSRNNIEMCRFEKGAWRGTGSKAEVSFTELRGEHSTSSRKITFKNSEDLPDVVDPANNASVNASFNMANTSRIGVEECNAIDAKKCTLSFDIKLSQEFFDTTFPYKHMFSLKIEDEMWEVQYTWLSFVDNPADFTYANTDNGWLHVSHDLSTAVELAGLGDGTYVITFGFFGITNTTRETASVVFDNIALVDNV